LNADLPEEERPKCEECTKVPRISWENRSVSDTYSALLTLSVEPSIGLLKFDFPLVKSLFDLFGVDEENREFSSALILFMVMETNKLRIQRRDKEMKNAKRKSERDDLKKELEEGELP